MKRIGSNQNEVAAERKIYKETLEQYVQAVWGVEENQAPACVRDKLQKIRSIEQISLDDDL